MRQFAQIGGQRLPKSGGANHLVIEAALAYARQMRLKSEIWLKAYIRRCAGAGVPAMVVHRGDSDAGIILIKVSRLDGTADLYAPAPAGYVGDDGERTWTLIAGQKSDRDIEALLARELQLDSDSWIIEVEDRQGRAFLDGWLART